MTIKTTKAFHVFFVGLSAIVLSGCENPFDCIIDDRPVLNTENLTQPVLNQVYESSISVSIKNNSFDDDYDYRWTLDGQLPPGIDYNNNHRSLRFSGTPTSLGDYPYSVSVSVSSDNYWQDNDSVNASDLCRQNVKREFNMTVAPL